MYIKNEEWRQPLTAPLIGILPSAIQYAYGDTAYKHAVTALATGESYTYDANGNMTQRVEGGVTYNQTFDAENRLISVTVGANTTSFVYDGDGNLVKKINPDNTRTIYVAGIYEVNKNSGGTVTSTKTYYPVAGAMRVGSTLYYALKDRLGSASVVTDSTGATVGEDRFYSFGETHFTTGNMQTGRLFTGQGDITDVGIYYFNARFYSPKLGRFLSADTIVPGSANPQSLNRYSYVLNRPIVAIDPSGHKCVSTGPEDCMTPTVTGRLVPINGVGGLTPWKPSTNNHDNNNSNNQPNNTSTGGSDVSTPIPNNDNHPSIGPTNNPSVGEPQSLGAYVSGIWVGGGNPNSYYVGGIHVEQEGDRAYLTNTAAGLHYGAIYSIEFYNMEQTLKLTSTILSQRIQYIHKLIPLGLFLMSKHRMV